MSIISMFLSYATQACDLGSTSNTPIKVCDLLYIVCLPLPLPLKLHFYTRHNVQKGRYLKYLPWDDVEDGWPQKINLIIWYDMIWYDMI